MTAKKPPHTPKLRRHSSGQGFVELNGRRIYLGRFDLPDAHQRYHQVIAPRIPTPARTTGWRSLSVPTRRPFPRNSAWQPFPWARPWFIPWRKPSFLSSSREWREKPSFTWS